MGPVPGEEGLPRVWKLPLTEVNPREEASEQQTGYGAVSAAADELRRELNDPAEDEDEVLSISLDDEDIPEEDDAVPAPDEILSITLD